MKLVRRTIVFLGSGLLFSLLTSQTRGAEPPKEPKTGANQFDPTRILTQPLHDVRFGHYDTGRVQAEWLADGRSMRILEEVRYVDPAGKTWIAPKYWIVDGASIPQAFWSLIGGPFEGMYREASVLHDYACDKKLGSSKEAARMFYHAMRCSRVPEAKAKTMYLAVLKYGPQWRRGEPVGGGAAAKELKPQEVQKIYRQIETDHPTLEELEAQK